MAIDVHTRRPKLTNIVGGLSGPAIRPIAVRMVYECRRAVKIPIIGMGGIATADDVLEFMIAGANAVQVGTMNFVDPFIWTKLMDGIRAYMDDPRDRAPPGHRRHGRHERAREGPGGEVQLVSDRILVALDVETRDEALRLADALRGSVGGFKIGSRLFTAEGPSMVRTLTERGDRVFLDLKFHDIPNTVATAVAAAAGSSASGWSTCTRAAGRR